jgi:hypothetical protein
LTNTIRPSARSLAIAEKASSKSSRLKRPISSGSEPLPNIFMIDAARYDTSKRQTLSHLTIVDARRPKARIVRRSFRQNVYSHAELGELLKHAGFRIETTWGMLAGGAFDSSETWHQTILARKPRRSGHLRNFR